MEKKFVKVISFINGYLYEVSKKYPNIESIDFARREVEFWDQHHSSKKSESDDKRYIMSINIAYANIGAHIALSEKSLIPLWGPNQSPNPIS